MRKEILKKREEPIGVVFNIQDIGCTSDVWHTVFCKTLTARTKAH